MPTFISLLRGINVSGQRKIRMADLKVAYEAVGLTNVNTYVQSGNVVFDCKMRSASKIAGLLEQQIESCFGYDVTVMVRTPSDFKRIIEDNPFSAQARKDPAKVHVTFLASRPSGAMVERVEDADTGGDEFSVGRQEILLYCPNGYGKTKLNNTFFERKLKMPATTRNWKTVKALYEMAIGS